MRITVDDAVFSGPDFVLDLLQLFQLALKRRHRILVDEDGPGYKAWRDARGGVERDECDLAIAESVEAEAREPARRTLRVVRSGTDWNTDPPRATVSEAHQLMLRPFRVLVENRRNDFRFLLAMANDAQRAELERRRKEVWLSVENGGGITDMKASVQEWKQDAIERLTLWVLFDSDARRPGQPSGQARALRGACGRHIPHHMLERRAIENYVTRPALEAWGEKKGIQARVGAFHAMPIQHQRSFFNMKHGLNKDEKSEEGVAEDLYGAHALDPALRAQIEHGFGPTLRDIFGDGLIRTADLIAEGVFEEMNGAVTELLAWMR